ncbi:MAG: hypothetical protein J0J04_07590 [Microbacterium sp.]|uniref:hypothetical protein n=1 Tax=Microbacterium sp. TaxID=51671 RepID=UPI001AC3F066|nr:hypothetical protein [Microbacterium sp.]MBN9214660.1 hypothetical protein [Microbacterium sp.]
MSRRGAAAAAAIVLLGMALSGCSLLGGDTLAQPGAAATALERDCDQLLDAAEALNTEVTSQFSSLDDGGFTTGANVRALTGQLRPSESVGPLAAAAEGLTDQYLAIAVELDARPLNPEAVTEAASKVMQFSSELALACR